MSMFYWPLENPVYDQSKSRTDNYQYLRSLFEQDFVDKFTRYPTMDKYCTGHHLKRILNERHYKGAHTEINYTEALRDLIELGVVKVPITDFDVVFVEWELGNLGDKIKNSQKLEQALFDWDGGTEQERKKVMQNGITTLSLIKRNEHINSHKYENFSEEELVQSPITIQIPQEQVAEVDAQIAESEQNQIRLTANFNYRPILEKYDAAAINKSVIKYSAAVLSVTDELIEILSEYEAAQSETIAEFLKISLKLKAKFTDNPNLTPEENKLLAERQKFLAERLELGTDAVKAQILSVKAQAENLSARIDKINRGDNSIRELAELQSEPRADFELLVENLAQIIKTAQQRVDFFAQNKNLVAIIVNLQATWTDSYKSFKTSLREELSAACREDSVDEEIFSAWYDDWQTKRFAIEQRFLPLVEFALKGNLLDSLDGVLKILGDYRDSVDKFYLHERKNIYQKFAFQAGGDLQEKFETESELYKLAEKFQRDLQEIIFSSDKTEERIFLLRWAEPILNISIDEISNFIRDKELDAISEEVLTQFADLRRQNFTAYIADSKSYSEAVQKRENEFNKLIYRMRKDLRKN
ncbi:MAG: hypothetical protein IJK81_04635 [Selenomonadaceae bacterium]|nr:hypothetical protein [Selenomonadaceae bacterium]